MSKHHVLVTGANGFVGSSVCAELVLNGHAVVSRLRSNLSPGLRGYWYLYLQAPWSYQAYRLSNLAMRQARRDEFQYEPLQKLALQSVFSRSLAIVDIEHPRQRGLTMRTFETMGSHKKLITTNAQVRDYDFLSRGNICVVDRADPIFQALSWSRRSCRSCLSSIDAIASRDGLTKCWTWLQQTVLKALRYDL